MSECKADMTLEANASLCANNGEIVLTAPSTVAFNCTYENPQSTGKTTYRWSVNGTVRTDFTSNVAAIPIASGSHYVTCEAFIDTAGCNCTDSKTLNVTIVGM